MYSYNDLFVERVDHKVAIIKVNRPHARNALNQNAVLELVDAVNKLNEMEDITAVILTGVDDTFISGADIKELTGISVSEAFKIASQLKALHNSIMNSPKLYIAAINGYCLGSGLELALVCDIRIAQHSAKFGLPEINRGIIPGNGGISRLTEITGSTMAGKLIFTGDMIAANEAKELNIVSDLFENVLKGGMLLAQTLSLKSKTAIAAAKRLINSSLLQKNNIHLEHELHEFSFLFDYPDSVEGMGAFLEKREPMFKN
jgi:enoyl-CoA hydratase/carnithine racemase